MGVDLGRAIENFAAQAKIGDTGYTSGDALNLLNNPNGTLSNEWKNALTKATGISGSTISSGLNFANNPSLGGGLNLANSINPSLVSNATGGLLNSTALGGAISLLNQPLSVGSVLQTGASIAFGPIGGFIAGGIIGAFSPTTIPDEVKKQSKDVAEAFLNPSNMSFDSISNAAQYAKSIITSGADNSTKWTALDDFANRCEDMKKSTNIPELQDAYQKLADGIKSGLNPPGLFSKGEIKDPNKSMQAFSDFANKM
jgi:hypothetical protein